jgi:hypothetical protein
MDDSSNPSQIAGVLGEMGKQAIGRLDQINEGYKTITHRDWPNLVPPMARQSAINLGLGSAISKYKTGGTLRGAMNAGSSVTGQQPTSQSTPAPTSHTFSKSAFLQNNPKADINAAAAAAQKAGYEVVN